MCFIKVLTPFAKLKRSSLLLKKRKYFEILHVEGSSRLGRKMRLILNKLILYKEEKTTKDK